MAVQRSKDEIDALRYGISDYAYAASANYANPDSWACSAFLLDSFNLSLLTNEIRIDEDPNGVIVMMARHGETLWQQNFNREYLDSINQEQFAQIQLNMMTEAYRCSIMTRFNVVGIDITTQKTEDSFENEWAD